VSGGVKNDALRAETNLSREGGGERTISSQAVYPTKVGVDARLRRAYSTNDSGRGRRTMSTINEFGAGRATGTQ